MRPVFVLLTLSWLGHAFVVHPTLKSPSARASSSSDNLFESYQMGSTQSVAVKDLQLGSGETPEEGNIVTCNYKGSVMKSGTVFGEGEIAFKKGFRDCMPGFEQGVEGCRAGGKRLIRVPPALGYGSRGSEKLGIPSNADLEFEIELTKLTSDPLNDFKHQFGIGANAKTAGIVACLLFLALSPTVLK